MQESGLTKSFLWYVTSSIWGLFPVFFTSWAPLGLMLRSSCSLTAVVSQVFFSWVPLGLTSSSWRAGIADDRDILIYWYGRKNFISQWKLVLFNCVLICWIWYGSIGKKNFDKNAKLWKPIKIGWTWEKSEISFHIAILAFLICAVLSKNFVFNLF